MIITTKFNSNPFLMVSHWLLSDAHISHAESARKTWNHHSSYRWPYFHETAKRMITHWLMERVRWENIDIGGGWYLSVPGSVVVDMSDVALDKNPAQEKYQCNLDDLACGGTIPVQTHRFDSATMISAWQYLSDPMSFLRECRRILKPGGKLYIINESGAGLDSLIKQAANGKSIARQIECSALIGDGYLIELESLPIYESDPTAFQCVTVTIPDWTSQMLLDFVGTSSIGVSVADSVVDLLDMRELPIDANTDGAGDEKERRRVFSKDLQDRFVEEEFALAKYHFSLLTEYPVTVDSARTLDRARMEAEEHEREVEVPVLLWSDYADLELDMMVSPDDAPFGFYLMEYQMPERSCDMISSLGQGKILRLHADSKLMRILLQIDEGKYSMFERQWKYDRQIETVKEGDFQALIRFLSRTPLNEFTRVTQQIVHDYLDREFARYHHREVRCRRRKAHNDPRTLEVALRKMRMSRMYQLFCANKQERKTEKLIAHKRAILSEGIEIIGTKTHEAFPHIADARVFKEMIRDEIPRGRPVLSLDD